MVMAGTERPPATTTDDSLASRLQWLRQRREALQEKLAAKNNELKNLCIDEAELTGVLPPEIPLEPGESPPAFRRRVATCFASAHPQNHVNRIKTNEADVAILGRIKSNEADLGILGRLKTNEAEESTLELERQVQVNIAEAALGIFNDPAESKAVRRKHRSIYQQSQRRLRELDARLNFIRQAYGRVHLRPHASTLEPSSHSTGDLTQSQINVKHRTKKPRPPLDNLECESSKTLPSRTMIQETGINLSPSMGESHHANSHVYRQSSWTTRDYRQPMDEPGTSNNPTTTESRNYNHQTTIDAELRRRNANPKYSDHDLNDNHDVYILPDRYRPRTYSQGTHSSSNSGQNIPQTQKFLCQDVEKNYRTIPNTYTEEERQMRYRQMQMKRHQETYNSHQQQQQISTQSQKLASQQNYRNYYPDHHHHHQQHFQSHQNHQHLDNRPSQSTYSHSDEFANRNRYKNSPEEIREINKNHSQSQIQRGRNIRESSSRLSKTNLPETTTTIDGIVEFSSTSGYWIRETDENLMIDDGTTTSDRFASLDRRKYNNSVQCSSYNSGSQSQQSTHEGLGSLRGDAHPRYSSKNHSGSSLASSSIPSSSCRDYTTATTNKLSKNSGLTSQQKSNNSQVHQSTTTTTTTASTTTSQLPRTLVRTQSLGSVETWTQPSGTLIGVQGRQGEVVEVGKVSGELGVRGRAKEKEWYETWMDSSLTMTLPMGLDVGEGQGVGGGRLGMEKTGGRGTNAGGTSVGSLGSIGGVLGPVKSVGTLQSVGPPPPPPPPPSPPSFPSRSKDHRIIDVDEQIQHRQMQQQQQQRRIHQIYGQNSGQNVRLTSPPKIREIPAESRPGNNEQRRQCDEGMGIGGNERSPDICTIVQAGKYQPYREVTKPFEMSDFYKYSTKYRKRAEAVGQMRMGGGSVCGGEEEAARRGDDNDDNCSIVNPVLRKIYEPGKRMTCQGFEGGQGKIGGDEGNDWRCKTNGRNSGEDSTVV